MFHKNFIDSYGLEPKKKADLDFTMADLTHKAINQISNNACFNDNYMVYSIKDVQMPQITDIYIDKEEDLLDRQQIVNFDEVKKTQE